jgi:hypothetical protein
MLSRGRRRRHSCGCKSLGSCYSLVHSAGLSSSTLYILKVTLGVRLGEGRKFMQIAMHVAVGCS